MIPASYSNSSASGDVKTDQASSSTTGFDSSGFSVNVRGLQTNSTGLPTWAIVAAIALVAVVAIQFFKKK